MEVGDWVGGSMLPMPLFQPGKVCLFFMCLFFVLGFHIRFHLKSGVLLLFKNVLRNKNKWEENSDTGTDSGEGRDVAILEQDLETW